MTVLGLILDVAGVALIWRFGLPADIRRTGASYFLLEETDEEEKKRASRYDRLSHAGMLLIVLGFLLQLGDHLL